MLLIYYGNMGYDLMKIKYSKKLIKCYNQC